MGALLCFASTAYSATYQTIPAVDGYDQISGADMVGMIVSGEINGTTTDSTWDKLVGGEYGASGPGWELSFNGANTFGSPWTVTVSGVKPLQTLTIDAFTAGVVFDINFINNNSNSTDGSASGNWSESDQDVSASFGSSALFDWEFTNEIALAGSSGPVGDLFGTLTLDFTKGGTIPGLTTGTSFYLDTDLIAAPIPSTITLLLFGGLGFWGFKRKNA